MKLSRKLEYACRVLAQLARFQGQSRLAHVDALAEAEKIPANYLVQILNELRTGGLITSKRGKQGGYALARPPAKILLSEILEVVDPEWLNSGFEGKGHSGKQVARVWAEIGESFVGKVSQYTLDDLVEADPGEMYYI